MIDDTLKRCPCCGGSVDITFAIARFGEDSLYSGIAVAACSYCGIEIDVDRNFPSLGTYSLINKAKVLWESRAEPGSRKNKGLLSCPFCGSEASLYYFDKDGNRCNKSRGKNIVVSCSSKDCHAYVLGDTLCHVKSVWNQRK